MEVSEKIRGMKGKPVTLTIECQGWDAPRNIILVRDTISHKTIKSFQLKPGFGYIRIINFLGSTDDELEGLSGEQVKIKKRFNGLNRAVEKISSQKELQNF